MKNDFSDIDGLVLPPNGDNQRKPAWYFYVVRTARREELASFLEKQGIETGIQYPKPVHRQQPYLERGFVKGDFPRAERWAKEVLSLPVHPKLSDDDVNYIIESVQKFFEDL